MMKHAEAKRTAPKGKPQETGTHYAVANGKAVRFTPKRIVATAVSIPGALVSSDAEVVCQKLTVVETAKQQFVLQRSFVRFQQTEFGWDKDPDTLYSVHPNLPDLVAKLDPTDPDELELIANLGLADGFCSEV